MYNVRIFLRLKKITVAVFKIVYMDDAINYKEGG